MPTAPPVLPQEPQRRDLTESTGVQVSDTRNGADGGGDLIGQVIGSWCRTSLHRNLARRDLAQPVAGSLDPRALVLVVLLTLVLV